MPPKMDTADAAPPTDAAQFSAAAYTSWWQQFTSNVHQRITGEAGMLEALLDVVSRWFVVAQARVTS